MSHADTAARGTVANRPTASRKLLSRKAAETAEGFADFEALEDSFPQVGGEAPLDDELIEQAPQATSDADDTAADAAQVPTPAPAAEPESLTAAASTLTGPAQSATAPLWSETDESAFQLLAARRKAAGYQRRGRDVGGQLLCVGEVTPNPGTVAAVIVALVAERGAVSRADLVAVMAEAAFPHPKAKPSERGWCQGYVAGCVRDGFLADAASFQGDPASGVSATGTEL